MLRWVRTNRSCCGLLALFALALQLYLSFGHVHAEDLGVAPASVAAPSGSPHAGGSAPQGDDDHDVCAICVALSLTASSVIPAPAFLPVPVAIDFDWPQGGLSVQRDVQFAAHFRARAPPAA